MGVGKQIAVSDFIIIGSIIISSSRIISICIIIYVYCFYNNNKTIIET